MKLKVGDQVKVIRGKDAGKSAKVEKIFTKESKVVVEGINQVKRHLKSRMPGQKSEIITLTKAMSLANVMLICQKCKQPTRVGYKMLKDGKTRVCKKCQAEIK